jgi:hypothetical protein
LAIKIPLHELALANMNVKSTEGAVGPLLRHPVPSISAETEYEFNVVLSTVAPMVWDLP